jgi:hypothetical protein
LSGIVVHKGLLVFAETLAYRPGGVRWGCLDAYREFGYGRLRGGVIGVLVKNSGGVIYPVEPGTLWVFNWMGYQRPSMLHSRYIILLAT